MLEELFFIHNNYIKEIPQKFNRYLYTDIDFKSNALCVFGSRGVGKTILLLQHCLDKYNGDPEKCLYLSGDNINVTANGLYKIAQEYFKYGGKALIIDEIHKYPNWAQETKNIIDTYKSKKILISGSSAFSLRMGKYDLSRRVVYYELKGLSFREFLNIEAKKNYKKYQLADLLNNHVKYAIDLSSNTAILKYFKQYLKIGYYPFYLEGKNVFVNRLNSVIEKILFEDIATIFNIRQSHISTLKKILWLVTSSNPFIPNIEKMSRDLSISKEYVYYYLEYLENSGLIIALKGKSSGYKFVRKPSKLFIENTNLVNAITGEAEIGSKIGNIRETFFVNQIRNASCKIKTHSSADFIVNDKIVFEIGGISKDSKQIKNIKNSYLAVENLEIGKSEKIPLYLFGFLY